jgi:hypothetical protein
MKKKITRASLSRHDEEQARCAPLPSKLVCNSALPPQFVKWVCDPMVIVHIASVLDGWCTASALAEAIPKNADQHRILQKLIHVVAEHYGVEHTWKRRERWKN